MRLTCTVRLKTGSNVAAYLSTKKVGICKKRDISVVLWFTYVGGDVGVARENCIFMNPELREAGRNRLMARNDREMCNYFAQLHLRNGSSKNTLTNTPNRTNQ